MFSNVELPQPSTSSMPSSGLITPLPGAEERVSFLDMDGAPEASEHINLSLRSTPESAVELHERLDIKALTRKLEDIRLETMDLQRFDISRRQISSNESTFPADEFDVGRVSTYTTDTVFWDWIKFAREGTQPKSDTKFWDWIKTLRGDSDAQLVDDSSSFDIRSAHTSELLASEENFSSTGTSSHQSVTSQLESEGSTVPSSTKSSPVVIYSDSNIRVTEHFDKGTYISTRTIVYPRTSRSQIDSANSSHSHSTFALRKLASLNCLKQDDVFLEDAMRLGNQPEKKQECITVWITQPIHQEELKPEWREAIRALYFRNDNCEMRGGTCDESKSSVEITLPV
ncbi:hypothetical protein VKT23_000391 [Stygiomarasmius scandens]|uniref:Uncharacterized protein n=1 Tax=Marasmiellus scandens TaxID=2682957 RepID=A0ABR1K6F5_9AGAR